MQASRYPGTEKTKNEIEVPGWPWMFYLFLIDGLVILHFLWILFIFFGIFLAWKARLFLWGHLTGLAFTLVLNLAGWYCPLTDLENFLSSLYRPDLTYTGSFLAQYLLKIIYLDLPEAYLRAGAIVWVALNLTGYIFLLRKKALRS